MRIMSNIPALQAYNALNTTNSALSKSIERLSTGLRINSAADDAAGLAISEKMRAQIRGLDQATANAQDGISMIQTAEGALSETHSILQRMRELSVQAANDTLTQEDRSYIQLEVDQLKEEITRISNTTQFNKKKLLDGSASVLWSSDNLATKAIVNGGLRQVDQFGQKSALEGNYKISINAEPGQAQIQKSDIFKIKHKNVIMNVSTDANNGFQKITVDNLPAGQYNIYQGRSDVSNGTTVSVAGAAVHSAGTAAFANATAFAGSLRYLTAAISGQTVAVLYVVGAGGIYNSAGTYVASGTEINLGTRTLSVGAAAVTSASTVNAALTSNSTVVAKFNNYDVVVSTFPVYTTIAGTSSFSFGGFYGLTSATASMEVLMSGLQGVQNASILLEVADVNDLTGVVTFRAQVYAMDANGKVTTHSDSTLMIGSAGVAEGYGKLGMTFAFASAITISNIADYQKGDKMVLNFKSTDAAATNTIKVSASVNQEWPNAWSDGNTTAANVEVGYNVNMDSLKGKDIHFKNYYLNGDNGTVYEGDIVISFNDKVKTMSAGSVDVARASFEAAYIGQVAEGDVKLRDLDKFWDANGRFMLEDPQTITVVQGNGKKASITLYSTDTLNDVATKLNDAIATGLGQSQYVKTPGAEFVSFVDQPIADNPESVKGTFVIRSLVPGAAGELNFSGDEDIIKAFSLNVIQDAKENTFTVSITDAHDGSLIAGNQKITGNVLYGVINPNVDVEFDSMANVEVAWNANSRKFELTKANGSYETILHLSDNTTVFQIGANEGEDMGIDIGDMSAHALGIDKVLVTDRESAARSITVVDNAINKVSKQRAKLGAYQNRLEHTINNLTTASTNTTAAESRIRDADMAKEMMNFTKLNILSQAGNSMLAQANQLPQNVLSLLR